MYSLKRKVLTCLQPFFFTRLKLTFVEAHLSSLLREEGGLYYLIVMR